jgi:hypothetical protein
MLPISNVDFLSILAADIEKSPRFKSLGARQAASCMLPVLKRPQIRSPTGKGRKETRQRCSGQEHHRRTCRCTYFPETDIPRVKYPGIWRRPAPIRRPIQRHRERLSTAHGGIQGTVEVAPHRQLRHHRQAARRRCRGMSSCSIGTGMRASRTILRTLEITIRTL